MHLSALDRLAPNIARVPSVWPDAWILKKLVSDLDEAISHERTGELEMLRSICESVCITVCEERGFDYSDRSDTGGYLSAALQACGKRHPQDASVLGRVLSQFQKLADALRDARNGYGTLAHGKDGYFDALAKDHVRTYVHIADLLVGAVLDAHLGEMPVLRHTRADAGTFADLNEAIDSQVTVEARVEVDADASTIVLSYVHSDGEDLIDLRVQPSHVLYYLDREAYIQAVLKLDTGSPSTEASETSGS